MRTHYEVWTPDTRIHYPGLQPRSWYDNDAPHYVRGYADKGQAIAAARELAECHNLPGYQVRRIAGRKPTKHFEGKSPRFWKPCRVYRVVQPCKPGYEGLWCLAWQNSLMPAPAFWYHRTRKEARDDARRFRTYGGPTLQVKP